jgi:hypothetical protein
MLFIYFYLISLSLIGYGLFSCKILDINLYTFGYLGILGVSFLTIISYSTSLFIEHSYFFNTIILILGLIFFMFFYKKISNFKKEFYNYLLIFSILILFIVVGKNHDDFSYYHFPYISILTEYSHPIGLGQLNNGFRNPSSIFFISSMFYLPKIDIYLFHITPAFFLGFANLILFQNIFNKNTFKENKFINFLSLICFIFINIFFYRLAEHGTDRSGQILIIICIILLLFICNNFSKNQNQNIIKFVCITLCLLISLKPFYLIYIPLVLIFFLYRHTRKIFLELFFSKTFFYCLALVFFATFYTFINSSCIVFPATFTCFENLSWSLSKDHIESVRIWYELWAKGGANPLFVVDNRIAYISKLNWLSNWIDIYFFNKVLDYILGLLLLFIIFFSVFYSKKIKKNKLNIRYLVIYYFLLICLIEWFMYHPSLRYGGYHLFALLLFIPLCTFLALFDLEYKIFFKKASFLILITIIVFLTRNVNRLNKEYKNYNYNPFIETKYKFIGGDKNFYFRYNSKIEKNKINYITINILGKNILNTTIKNRN